MKKIIVLSFCSIVIIVGMLLLNPVDYYQKFKYTKVLNSFIDEDKLIIGDALDIGEVEIQEVKHLGGHVFEIVMEDNSLLVSIEEYGSGNSLKFFEYNTRIDVFQ